MVSLFKIVLNNAVVVADGDEIDCLAVVVVVAAVIFIVVIVTAVCERWKSFKICSK